MIIREATNKDVDPMLRLVKDVVDYHCKIDGYYKPFSKYRGLKSYLKQQLKDKDVKTFIAEENGKIIGRMVATIVRAPSYVNLKRIGMIDDAFIRPDYRRKGIGNKLFKELTRYFLDNKLNYVELSVDARNNVGIDAWKKFGFRTYRLKLRLNLEIKANKK